MIGVVDDVVYGCIYINVYMKFQNLDDLFVKYLITHVRRDQWQQRLPPSVVSGQ